MRIRAISRVVVAGGMTLSLATPACTIRAGTGYSNTPAPAPMPVQSPPPGPVATPAPAPAPPPAPVPGAPPRLVHVPGTLAAAPKITAPTRFGNADEHGALRGLVYFLPEGTQRLPDFSTMTPQAVLYTNQLNVPLADFNEGFPGVSNRVEWFGIRYEGRFTISRPGTWFFKVVSDDGSIVSIDGQPVMNNDGVHTPQLKTVTMPLAAGSHTLRVDYFQALRWAVQLQLWVTGPGELQEHLWAPNL